MVDKERQDDLVELITSKILENHEEENFSEWVSIDLTELAKKWAIEDLNRDLIGINLKTITGVCQGLNSLKATRWTIRSYRTSDGDSTKAVEWSLRIFKPINT